MRRVLPALLAAVVPLMGADSASAAAPWFVIVHGSLVDEPVLLDDWDENQELMLAISETAQGGAEELEGRRYVELAMFWGPDWMDHPRDAGSLSELSPERATQHARFYPAVGSEQPGLVLLEDVGGVPGRSSLRVVGPKAIAVLEAHGIPIRVEPKDSSSALGEAGFVGASLALVIGGLLFVTRRRRVEVDASSTATTRPRW